MVPVMYNPMRMLSPRRKLVLQRSKRQRGLAPPRGSGILVDAEWRTAMTRLLKYFGAAGILLAAATISPAQNAATSELHVTVKDPKGAVVTNATVAARDEGNRAGRTLAGIFGRRIATLPGYKFSEALAKLDIVWTPETVSKLFEIGPMAYTPGTKMPEHQAAGPLTLHVLSGSMAFRAGDRTEEIRSGELIVLESAIGHELEALEESACLLTLANAS